MFSGTVSATSVGFRCLCVSRHKARRRLPAKNAKSRWMALKHCVPRKRWVLFASSHQMERDTDVDFVHPFCVFMEFVFFASCNLCLLLVPFCRILIILWSVRIPTDSLDDAQRWNIFLRILLVPQLDVQPHPSTMICFIRSKMPSALQ